MLESFTAGANRAIERARARARQRGAAAVEPTDLLAALVDESESRAAELLAEFGLDPDRVWSALGTDPHQASDDGSGATSPLPPSAGFRAALSDAEVRAR